MGKRRGRPPDPRDAAEWQEAVDLAALCRALWDCHLYGLLEGGLFRPGNINVRRCDYILKKGGRRGVRPAPFEELARRYLSPAEAVPAETEGGRT